MMIEEYAQVIVLLRLTTDRHKASHSLSATAELLVSDVCTSAWRNAKISV